MSAKREGQGFRKRDTFYDVYLAATNKRELCSDKLYYVVHVHDRDLTLVKRSLYVFEGGTSGLGQIRLWAIWLMEWKYFDRIVLLVIILNGIALAHPVQYDPSYEGTPLGNFIDIFSTFSTLFFLGECLVKVVARGLVFGDAACRPYLRDSSNWLDFFVVCTSILEIFVLSASKSSGGSSSPTVVFRAMRVLRALRAITVLPDLRNLVSALIESMWRLVFWLFMVVFVYIVFVIIGYGLFSCSYWSRCRLTPAPIQQANGTVIWPIDYSQPRFCGGRYSCAQGTYCGKAVDPVTGVVVDGLDIWHEIESDPMTDYGFTGFQSFQTAMLTIFQASTMEGWHTLLSRFRDAAGDAVAIIYFYAIVLYGGLILLNLVIAILWERFDTICRMEMHTDEHKRLQLLSKSREIETIDEDILDMRLYTLVREVTQFEKKEAEEKVLVRLDAENQALGLQIICFSICSNPWFDHVMLVIICINALALAFDAYPSVNETLVQVMELVNTLCTVAFMGEAAIKVTALGIEFFGDQFNCFDLALVVISAVELFGLEGDTAVSALRTARLLRLMKLMRVQVSIRVLLRVFHRATVPSYNFCILLILSLYCLSLLGLLTLRPLDKCDETQLSFNDILSSLITGSTLLLTDGWFDTYVCFAHTADKSQLVFLIATAFFVGGLLLCHYIFMSLFLAIFACNFALSRHEISGDYRKRLMNYRQINFEDEVMTPMSVASEIDRSRRKSAGRLNHSRWPPPIFSIDDDLQSRPKPPMNLLAMCRLKKQAFIRQLKQCGSVGFSVEEGFKDIFEEVVRRHSRLEKLEEELSLVDACFPLKSFGETKMIDHIDHGSMMPLERSAWRNSVEKMPVMIATAFGRSDICDVPLEEVGTCFVLPVTNPGRKISKIINSGLHRSQQQGTGDSAYASDPINFHELVRQSKLSSALDGAQNVFQKLGEVSDVDVTVCKHTGGEGAIDTVEVLSAGEEHPQNDSLGGLALPDREEQVALVHTLRDEGVHSAMPTAQVVAPIREEYSLLEDHGDGRSVHGFRSLLFSVRSSEERLEGIIMFLILVSSIQLGAETPYLLATEPSSTIFMCVEIGVVIAFTIEMIVKLLGHGAWIYYTGWEEPAPRPYFRVAWNWIDFVATISGIVDLILVYIAKNKGNGVLQTMRSVRLVRVLRPLRLMRRNKGMRVIADCLIQSVPTLANMTAIYCLLYFGCAILFVNVLKGALYACSLDIHGDQRPDIVDKKDCLRLGGDWVPLGASFDNIGESLLTLLNIGTGEGWVDVMFLVASSQGLEKAPRPNSNPLYGALIILFVLIANFFMFNMFVGVLCDQYMVAKSEQDNTDVLSTSERLWRQFQFQTLRPQFWVPNVRRSEGNRFRMLIRRIVESKMFECLAISCIVVNTAMLCFDNPWRDPHIRDILTIISDITVLWSIVEVALRCVAAGHSFYLEALLVIDVVIALGSLSSLIAETAFPGDTATLVLRFFRVGRVIRLALVLPALRMMSRIMIELMAGLTNVLLLLLIMLYMFSCLGYGLFGAIKPGTYTADSGFRDIGMAFLTLFRCATGEKWHLIMNELAEDQPGCIATFQEPGDIVRDGPLGCGEPWYAYAFFISFMLAIRIVLFNLVIAVILDSYQIVEDVDALLGIKIQIGRLRSGCWKFDPDQRGLLLVTDMVKILRAIEAPIGFGRSSTEKGVLQAMGSIRITNDRKVHMRDIVVLCSRRAYLWLSQGYEADIAKARFERDLLAEWYDAFPVGKELYTEKFLVSHIVVAKFLSAQWVMMKHKINARIAAGKNRPPLSLAEREKLKREEKEARQFKMLMEVQQAPSTWATVESRKLQDNMPQLVRPLSILPWPPAHLQDLAREARKNIGQEGTSHPDEPADESLLNEQR